jgi:hypothetical protein
MRDFTSIFKLSVNYFQFHLKLDVRSLSKAIIYDLPIFEVLEELWRGLEDPRIDRIYSSGNRGVKKGPGPRGTRGEEFLVPSLYWSML